MADEGSLSQVPPADFTKARDALARQLRERGKKEESERVAALRRPTVPLWIVNQLGRRASAAVEDLIDATQRARRAQMHAAARDELHEAMHGKRGALQRLLAEAQGAAAAIGARITPEIQRRIQDTLQTAAAEHPKELREGALEAELSAAGFGALLEGVSPVAVKAAAQRSAHQERIAEKKEKLAAKRDQLLRQREVRQAQEKARRLAARAGQLEEVARRAKENADKAQAKAKEARAAADMAAARVQQVHR
jgi:hypothetical protein